MRAHEFATLLFIALAASPAAAEQQQFPATLAGHVTIEDHATVGAFSGIHQYCRVGTHGFVGGYSVVTKDVLPYSKTVSERDTHAYGPNVIGLERKGFSREAIDALQKAYRILTRSKQGLDAALEQIDSELALYPEARYLTEFVRGAKRGIIR